jgi:hypothetical protein
VNNRCRFFPSDRDGSTSFRIAPLTPTETGAPLIIFTLARGILCQREVTDLRVISGQSAQDTEEIIQ